MAQASASISDIAVTTLRKRSGKLRDNVTRNNTLLRFLEEKAMDYDGGRVITEEIEFASNPNGLWYSGYQTLKINPASVFTASEWMIRQAAVAVSVSGLELIQNAGSERSINLLQGKIKNAENTFENL